MNIIISPYSVNLKEFENPKNYPHWRKLVGELRLQGHKVIQLGLGGDRQIGANNFLYQEKLRNISGLVRRFDLWMSVDNFLPHLCNAECPEKRGIVLFSQSDPDIFGYPQNINLLTDKSHLREHQWQLWTQTKPQPEAWDSLHARIMHAMREIC